MTRSEETTPPLSRGHNARTVGERDVVAVDRAGHGKIAAAGRTQAFGYCVIAASKVATVAFDTTTTCCGRPPQTASANRLVLPPMSAISTRLAFGGVGCSKSKPRAMTKVSTPIGH